MDKLLNQARLIVVARQESELCQQEEAKLENRCRYCVHCLDEPVGAVGTYAVRCKPIYYCSMMGFLGSNTSDKLCSPKDWDNCPFNTGIIEQPSR